MTTDVALFACPHCIDEFRFDYHKIAKLTCGWRVRARCPSCGNIVEVVMLQYTLIHGCDPNKYKQGEIVESLPPDANQKEESLRLNTSLYFQIHRKKGGWRLG